jgi:hypothetical protein
MSTPENPIPNPQTPPAGHRGPQTVTVRIPVAPKEPVVAEPVMPLKKAAVPPPLPAKYLQSAVQTESANETRPEVGKPQLRAPEMKLAAAPAQGAPAKPAALPAPRKAGSIWLVRMGLCAGLGIALALLYWSVFVRLLPITKQHNAKALQMTRAADELETLRRRFSAEEIEGLRSRYAQAQDALFDLKSGATDWQTQVEEEARNGTLTSNVKLGTPALITNVAGIAAITAEVVLQPNVNERTNVTAYARLLKFTDGLASTAKRLDLLELSVTGDSNSVSQAQVVVQLLAGEKKQ